MTDPAVTRILEALADLPDQDGIDPARFTDGATFVTEAGAAIPAIWGRGKEVLWASGEATWLAGWTGTGKTTLAQQVMLGRLGLRDTVLGYPVEPVDGKVLLLAMDRPRQAARSLARMVPAKDLKVLEERLVVWQGPPPSDVARRPDTLLRLARQADARDLFIDSMKDAALKLSEDETGSSVNRALQELGADDREAFCLHHVRKTGGVATASLGDIYGSTWLTSGAGSVLLLGGAAGDPLVTCKQVKFPDTEVGPLELLHDQDAGRTTVVDAVDLYELLRTRGPLTAEAAARVIFRTEPDKNHTEKARRRLDRLVTDGLAVLNRGQRGGQPSTWSAVDLLNHGPNHGHDLAVKGPRQTIRITDPAGN